MNHTVLVEASYFRFRMPLESVLVDTLRVDELTQDADLIDPLERVHIRVRFQQLAVVVAHPELPDELVLGKPGESSQE